MSQPFQHSDSDSKPDLSNLITWGAKVWIKLLDVGKLEPRAIEVNFFGYDGESKGYRVYWPKAQKVSIERDVYFDKQHVFEPESVQIEGENSDLLNAQDGSASQSTTTTTTTPEQKKDESNQSTTSTPIPVPIPLPPEKPPVVLEPRRSGRTQQIEGRYRALDERGKEDIKIADAKLSFEEIIENVLIANPEDEPPVKDALVSKPEPHA
jgi:hypothetical protein